MAICTPIQITGSPDSTLALAHLSLPLEIRGNALGITVDPKTDAVIYVGADCRFLATCTIERYDLASSTQSTFAQLSGSDVSFVDGITFDPPGDHLFLSTRAPGRRLTILDRSGHIVQSVPIDSEPDGISFHGTDPQFVVTNNTDGTMTRFDFPGNDVSKAPTQSTFASGGFRGDLSLVGADGCIYLTQDGTHFLDGTTTGDNSIVQICPGFAPSPGVHGDKLVYVAVGDSYSSGEGAPPFEDGKNYPAAVEQENTLTYGSGHNDCHRSVSNYAKLDAPIIDPAKSPTLVDRTCSGADIVPPAGSAKGPIVPTQATADRNDSQVHQALERLNRDFGGRRAEDVDLVSTTMGGNDGGFGSLIQACLIPNIAQELFRDYSNTPGEIEWVVSHFGSCKNFDNLFFHTGDKIKKLKDLELEAQAGLTNTFKNARVLQLTYPGIVPTKSDFAGDSCGGILRQDASYVRGKVQDIDDAVRGAGATTTRNVGSRFQIVDLQNSFGDSALCPADPTRALANGVDQVALSAVVQKLAASGTESRALLDNLSNAYQNFRNCVITHAIGGILGEVLCKGRLDSLNAALDKLKAYFTPDRIRDLVSSLAPGDTPEQRFDNSRLLFHPNAAGFGVMGCNLGASYQDRNGDSCQPDLKSALTYLFNGIHLSTTAPQVITPGAPIPFQFNGFDPGTLVVVQAFSTPVNVGTFTVDSSGTVSGTITLPPTLNPGVHRLQFTGTNNHSPRTVQVLTRIDGRPRGGEDYGLYVPGFTDEEVRITYGGLDWGITLPDEDGGVFVELPLPKPDIPGSIEVRVVGTTTHKVVTEAITPAPASAGTWARSSAADALAITGSGIRITGWAHSDGGVRISGNGIRVTGGLEYATSTNVAGTGNTISPAPVRRTPGGSPVAVDITDWRPGAAMSQKLGKNYADIPLSACHDGTWRPRREDVTTTVVYVPCGVDLAISGPLKSAIIAEGPIRISGNGLYLMNPGIGFSLASAARGDDAIAITGNGVSIASALWAAGGARLSGPESKLGCGVYANTISITGSGVSIAACPGG